MFCHAPPGYDCPFCRLVAGSDLGPSGSTQRDLVYQDDEVAAWVASKWWPNNKGHVLVVPVAHYENTYELPPELATPIQRLAREIALAMKEVYGCDGISIRQHNEPRGGQDVWHYHLHLFPRYPRDFLSLTRGRHTLPEQRWPYAERLKNYLAQP